MNQCDTARINSKILYQSENVNVSVIMPFGTYFAIVSYSTFFPARHIA